MKRNSVALLLLLALCAPAAAAEPAAASPGATLESLWTFLDSVVKLPLTWWENVDSRVAGSEDEPSTERSPHITPDGLKTLEPDEPPTEKGPDIDPWGLQAIEPDEPSTEKGPSSDPLG